MSEVCGLGLDLCEISRMEANVERESFVRRVFTPAEQAYAGSRGKMAPSSYAAMWAAKEACLKAMGCGIVLPMTDVEILHDEDGRPYYCLHGEAEKRLAGGSALLSISHEAGMAAAVCVLTRKND